MDAAVLAWLKAQLGAATPSSDLETRYARLGTARAVALEILRERLAALLEQPSTVTVTSVVGVSYTENIKAYERKIAQLESGQPPAPDDPAGSNPDTLGVLYLKARSRR
ncbi:hypothetical protein [Streptomyces sp. NPDC007991]|uniref:hypothetical protein n=1 Tax=Streptomyces sp. NPDC007991 TaxID=3364803 RepID=UPI0036E5F674